MEPIAEVSHRLAERVEDLALELLGEPTSRTCDEWRYRSHGSLRVCTAGPKRGRFTDFEAGEGGDGIDLIGATQGIDTREALKWARAWLGIEREGPGAQGPRATRGDTIKWRLRNGADNRSEAAREIWRGARAAEGTHTETYLRSRGTAAIPPTLRHSPVLMHWPTGTPFPTMVAAVTRSPDKRVVAVQRTFLRPDGQGKAVTNEPRPGGRWCRASRARGATLRALRGR